MSVPLISEYIKAIKLAEDNLDKLSYLRPILNSDGNPIMSSGNFAVVFKMRSKKNGKFYALKCFIKEQPERDESYRLIADELEYVSSEYLVHVRYLEKELFVDTATGKETEFPVLLMDWVEGATLDKWIRQHLDDQYNLQLITYQFCRMASWLMSQPFAHRDIKPDNIIVRDDGSLVLVDYDGMYVPAMQGQKSRELGSPDYRHPARTADDFNEHIDDFSLAAIAMQLCAIALDPRLFANQTGDTLLLTEHDHRDLANSNNHHRLHSLFHNADFERLYALYHLAHAQQTLSNISFRAFQFPKPEKKPEAEKLSTKVTDEDKKNGVKDEFGALYSLDGKRLLEGANIESYTIKAGTMVVCTNAFYKKWHLNSITIPDSVTHIGANPCAISNVRKIKCDSSFFEVDESALYSKGKKTIIAFFNRNASKFTIPNSVTHIGDYAFNGCNSLSSITIPNSVTHIDGNPFVNSGVRKIICDSLLFKVDEFALYSKGQKTLIAFFNRVASKFSIPDSVTHIGDYAFNGCNSLSSITISDSVTHIGDYAFYGCNSLYSITIHDSVTYIGDSAFMHCHSLHSITIPNSVTHIGNHAFCCCESLSSITIPDSVTHIGDGAFWWCRNLSSITIPSSVTYIGDSAFLYCNLTSIIISQGSRSKFERMLPKYLHDKLEEQL